MTWTIKFASDDNRRTGVRAEHRRCQYRRRGRKRHRNLDRPCPVLHAEGHGRARGAARKGRPRPRGGDRGRYTGDKKTRTTRSPNARSDIISWDTQVPDGAIKVQVEKGWVTLTGQVDWYFQKEAATAAVRRLAGVIGVVNSIEVKAACAHGGRKGRRSLPPLSAMPNWRPSDPRQRLRRQGDPGRQCEGLVRAPAGRAGGLVGTWRQGSGRSSPRGLKPVQMNWQRRSVMALRSLIPVGRQATALRPRRSPFLSLAARDRPIVRRFLAWRQRLWLK